MAERRLAWAVVAGMLAAGALGCHPLDAQRIDWQPALAASQPWRAWTAVFVHYSSLHLAANLAGAVLVGALGLAANAPWRSAAAWLLAWPLTQFGLTVQPQLLHYGGLSGVLHAGVAVIAIHLLCCGHAGQRRIGAVILAGLLVKVASETPWAGPLRHPAGWDIAVAPLAHASGVLMGALCAGAAELLHRRYSSAGMSDRKGKST